MEDRQERPRPSLVRATPLAVLAGFCAISLQALLVRVAGLSAGSSEYAFAVIVGVFILMLALGAWALAARRGTPVPLWVIQSAVLAGCLALYLLIPSWPWLAHVARIQFSAVEVDFYFYHLTIFLGLVLMLLLPVGAMGATMPLLFGTMRTRHGRIGLDIGRLYAANTVGCVAGAPLGGYLLLYPLNLDQVFRICLALAAATIFLSVPRPGRDKRGLAVVAMATAIALVTPWLPAWNPNYMGLGLFRIREAIPRSFSGPRDFWCNHFAHLVVLDYRDGPNVSVSTVQNTANPTPGQFAPHPSRILLANGKSEGNMVGNDLRTTRLLAHIPALLQTADSRKALVIGFGTGITVGSLTLYDEIDEVHCAEISPVVRNMAPYFEFANHEASRCPKVQWRMGDAYRVLGKSSDRYSVIVFEPSNPSIAGVEKLYMREFFEKARRRLAPGGIYVQCTRHPRRRSAWS